MTNEENNPRVVASSAQLKKNYFWNTLGSLMNALSSVLMLALVTQSMGAAVGGIFALAYAVGQQCMVIGCFEMRPLQATDVDETYSFGTYEASRIITSAVMVVGLIGFALYTQQDFFARACIIAVGLLRLLDSVEDVFHGMFQQHNRLDIAGRAFFFRVLVTTVTFGALAFLTRNLLLSCVVSFVLSAVALVFLNIVPARGFVSLHPSFDLKPLKSLLWACTPLFLGAFLLSFVVNEPRYALAGMYSKEFQTYFACLFMPALVINLLSGFVFKPLLTTMADYYTQANYRALMRIMGRALAVVLIATILGLVLAWPLGIPILSWFYNVDLSPYKPELMVLILGGLFNSLSVLLYYLVVTMRCQRLVVLGYGMGAVVALIASKPLISSMGLMGAALLYDLSMAAVSAVFLVVVVVNARAIAAKAASSGPRS